MLKIQIYIISTMLMYLKLSIMTLSIYFISAKCSKVSSLLSPITLGEQVSLEAEYILIY